MGRWWAPLTLPGGGDLFSQCVQEMISVREVCGRAQLFWGGLGDHEVGGWPGASCPCRKVAPC